MLGGNPVYNAPADLDWAKTQRKAKTVVTSVYYEDETFAVSDWHLPMAQFLESWGDARTADGTVVSIQPLIAPLFGGLTELEVLAQIGGLEKRMPLLRHRSRDVQKASAAKAKKRGRNSCTTVSGEERLSAGPVQFDGSALSRALSGLPRSAPPSADKLGKWFSIAITAW